MTENLLEEKSSKVSYKSTILACYIGYFVQATVINLAPILFIPLKEQFGLTYSQLGSLVLINFLTQVLFDVAFSKSVDKYGFRLFAVPAHILCSLGFVLFAFTPFVFTKNIYLGLILSTVIFSGGGGLLELLISPIIDAIPGDDKTGAMSLLHSFYAWGQVTVIILTSFFLFIFGIDKWPIIVLFWAIPPLINTFIFSKVPLAQKVHESNVMKIRELIVNPIFIIAFFAIMFGAASEVTMNQWASTFMEKSLSMPKVYSDIIGMGSFAVMLGIGRLIYGKYGSKINVSKVMIYGSLLACMCYIVVALSPINSISLIACAFCGIFVSLLWPGTLVVASEKLPLAGASMFALLAAAGDVGASIGPWLVGFVTDLVSSNTGNSGLRFGLLIASILPIITMILHKYLYNLKLNSNK